MGVLINRVERSEIKGGDHIYTYRAAFTYSHHGIFVGENKVIHFTPNKDLNPVSWISSDSSFYNSTVTCSSYPECGFRQPNSGVVRSCLDCFLRNGTLYRYEYGVSKSVFLAHVRGGTCSTAKSDPPEEVIHRATYLLQSGFGNYDLLQNNCENFALYCKTGLLTSDKIKTNTGKAGGSHNFLNVGTSGQVTSVSSVFEASGKVDVIWSTLQWLVPRPVTAVSRATVMAAMYCLDKYAADIGVRDDVSKVAVEDLAVNLGWEGHHEEVADDSEASMQHFVTMNSMSVSIFDGTNFSNWSEQIQFYLGVLDLDLALRIEKPPTITNSSSAEENAIYKSWERSNRLSIMFMRMKIANNIKPTLPECDNAKEFFKTLEERFQSADKSLSKILMAEPTTMKFDGTREMHEHIIEMTNLAIQLKALGTNVDESFLVQFILNSLPPQYESFQIQYNTSKDKCNVNDLTNMLVQEEARLKQQEYHSVHLLSQGAEKVELSEVNGPPQLLEVHEKRRNNVIELLEVNGPPQVIEVHEKRQNNVIEPLEVNEPPQVIEVHENRQNNVIQPPEVNGPSQVIEIHENRQNNVIQPPEINGPPQVIEIHERRQNNVIQPPEINGPPQVIEIHERRQNNVQCYFCRNFGHVKKNCHKRRAWFTNRGLPYYPDLRP